MRLGCERSHVHTKATMPCLSAESLQHHIALAPSVHRLRSGQQLQTRRRSRHNPHPSQPIPRLPLDCASTHSATMLRPAVLLLAALAALLFCLPQSSSLTVHVVPHTHDDVGWLKTVDEYYYGLKNDIQHAAVQYILKSVTAALIRNPARKFMYVEQAFFQRFWREATEYDKNITRQLVANGQLEFVNGGWCMHDEAAAHYVDMIDQTTLGHRFIVEEFGQSAVPTIGWQIDPFGHSATQAALLSAEVGFNGLFFGRIDYQDHDKRIAEKNLEFVWRASASLGASAQIFSGAFQSGNYGPPDGFCFDVFDCNDEVIQANPNVGDYNLDRKVQDFIKAAKDQAAGTRGNIDDMNIMWTMGSDFQHEASEQWMTNLDNIIDGVNAEGSIKALYSTPSIYLKAKNAEQVQWTVKTDDFFPYADGGDSFWTGYFTSRPALKRYIRVSSAFLQVARHMELLGGGNGSVSQQLWEAQSVAQHHDAVSGTAKQAVTFDYAQRISKGSAKADELIEATLAAVLTNEGGDKPAFAYCPLYNVSQCDVVTNSSASAVVIALYNPNARAWTNATISVPSASATNTIYASVDGKSVEVNSTTLPVFATSANADGSAKFRVWFQADVPGIGINTYFLKGAKAEATPEPVSDMAAAVHKRHAASRTLKSVEAPREEEAAPSYIENDLIRVNIDPSTGAIQSVDDKRAQTVYNIQSDWAYYDSYQAGGQASGAYIFRPAHEGTTSLSAGAAKLVAAVNTPLVSEAWVQISDWIFTIIRLRAGVAGVEFEWTVGPVPVDDGQGKEVILRFNTSMLSNGTWYTDSNGREFQQRVRNERPTWKWDPTQPTAGNYYPINAAQWLTDGTNALVVNNDRSQGGASITDGSLEFMVHRRMTQDDGRGVGEALSEPGLDGKGLIITGTHVVHLVPLQYAAEAARVTASIIYTPLHQSYAPLSGSVDDYLSSHKSDVSFLKTNLPPNVDMITAQWYGSGVLLRFAHQFGAGESARWSTPVTFDLASLFVIPISDAQEVTLSAALPVGQRTPYSWNTTDSEEAYTSARVPLQGTQVTINPAEVRTFIVTVQQA